jgi:hypothetical protein
VAPSPEHSKSSEIDTFPNWSILQINGLCLSPSETNPATMRDAPRCLLRISENVSSATANGNWFSQWRGRSGVPVHGLLVVEIFVLATLPEKPLQVHVCKRQNSPPSDAYEYIRRVPRRLIGMPALLARAILRLQHSRSSPILLRSRAAFIANQHRNPVRLGCARGRKIGSGAASATTRPNAKGWWRSNRNGLRAGANGLRGGFVLLWSCATQAKRWLEWATRHFVIIA